MRISDCPKSDQASAGFTLIEILVVLLIVTVMAGVTIARFPAIVNTADLDEESRRLELLFDMARNEALLDSVEYGFQLKGNGYEFLRYDDATQDWVAADSPYHRRTLAEGLELKLKAASSQFLGESSNLPTVLILSSGESTPFDLELSVSGQAPRTLSTDGYGDFIWLDDE